MPSLKAIRKRIGSVKNTQKITRAMKLVAAARLRRAQDAIIAARPYATSLERVMGDLARATGAEAHPLLKARPEKRATVVVMSSDRGLAGSFNAALIRQVERFLRSELKAEEVSLRTIGRKSNDYFRRRDASIEKFVNSPESGTALTFSRELANELIDAYLEERTDAVYLAFNEFRAPGSQTVRIVKLMPVQWAAAGVGGESAAQSAGPALDFVFEPSREALLQHLLPLHIQVGLYRAALESIASELGARMAAMDAATKNAGEMIAKLTLQYNRARQAAITKELLEIIAGAESLNG